MGLRAFDHAGILLVVAVVVLTVLLTTFALPTPAAGQYRWVDDSGIVHWSQDLQSVPEQYRSSATKPSLPTLPAVPPPPPPEKRPLSLEIRGSWIRPRYAPRLGYHQIFVDVTLSQQDGRRTSISPARFSLRTRDGVAYPGAFSTSRLADIPCDNVELMSTGRVACTVIFEVPDSVTHGGVEFRP